VLVRCVSAEQCCLLVALMYVRQTCVFCIPQEMITTLVSGPLLALAVIGSTDTVQQLRELCGPVDPEVAKALRPGAYSSTLEAPSP
jgi:nucleoside diphosphate kinase